MRGSSRRRRGRARSASLARSASVTRTTRSISRRSGFSDFQRPGSYEPRMTRRRRRAPAPAGSTGSESSSIQAIVPPKLALRATAAAAVRNESAFSSSRLPRPATATRFAPACAGHGRWWRSHGSRVISPDSDELAQLPVELAVERVRGARERRRGLGYRHREHVRLDLPRRRDQNVDLRHREPMLSDVFLGCAAGTTFRRSNRHNERYGHRGPSRSASAAHLGRSWPSGRTCAVDPERSGRPRAQPARDRAMPARAQPRAYRAVRQAGGLAARWPAP